MSNCSGRSNRSGCARAGSAAIAAGEFLPRQSAGTDAGDPSFRLQALSVSLALLINSLAGCTNPHHGPSSSVASAEIVTMKVPFKIGRTVVTAEVFQRGKPWPTMINVHDDENTSVVAGKIIIEQSGGRLIELSHGGHRLVRFQLNGEQYSFDPNRIFSDTGIRATLEKQSTWSEAAHHAVKQFATQYLEHFGLDREPVIVALHNNSEGALSIHSFYPGAEHAAAAASVHVGPARSPDDFFYVTDQRFFDYLKQRDFNVILQDNASVPDDGSLSVYFARKGIPYVNIEAELNHLNAQIEMIRTTREMVDEIFVTQTPSGR